MTRFDAIALRVKEGDAAGPGSRPRVKLPVPKRPRLTFSLDRRSAVVHTEFSGFGGPSGQGIARSIDASAGCRGGAVGAKCRAAAVGVRGGAMCRGRAQRAA